MSRTLAIDLGGTNLRVALCDCGRPEAPEPIGHWPAPADLAGLEAQIAKLVTDLSPDRLGIAVPGFAEGTTCVWVPNLPYLDGADLAGLFPRIPIALGNDAQLALLAEATAGAARTLTDAILLAIGTGIGSAALSGSRILRGSRGAAASFGWACADLLDTGDESVGWLERQASGRALDRLAREAGLEGGEALIGRARQGDAKALRLLEAPARAIGTSLAGAVALLGSQAVLVSGGVAMALDMLGPMIGAALKRQLPPHLRGVTLVSAAFGPGASLIGASIAACGSEIWEQKG